MAQYGWLTLQLKDDRDFWEKLKAAMADPHAPEIREDSVRVSPAGEAPYVRDVEMLEQLAQKIRLEEELLSRLKAEMIKLFTSLPSRKRNFLLFRYISGMKWEEICLDLDIARPTAMLWHRECLAGIVLPENAVDVAAELTKLE